MRRFISRLREWSSGDGLLATAPAQPMTVRREAAGFACLTLIAAVIALVSARHALFSGDVTLLLARGDSHTINWSKVYFLDARLRNGEFPLWDPTQMTGQPYSAHPLAMASYPPNLIRALLVGAETAQTFLFSMYGLLFFQLLLGGWGMYFLARGEGISLQSSVIVSLGVMFCERWVINGIYETQEIATCSWTPVVLVVLRHAMRMGDARRRVGWALLAGILYGFQVLSGWPQTAIYATIVYVAFVALHIVPELSNGTFTGRTLWRGAVTWVSVCAAFGITGGLVAACLILPARELMDASARSIENFPQYDVAPMVNKSGSYFFEMSQRESEPGALPKARAFTRRLQMTVSQTLGLSVITLTSVFLILRYRVLVYFLIGFLVFDLTYGPPLPVSTILDLYAPFAISTPWYQVALLSVPLGVLAGFALDKLLLLGGPGRLPWNMVVPMAALGVAAVVLGKDPVRPDPVWTATNTAWVAGVLAVIVFGQRLQRWRALVSALLVLEIANGANVSTQVATEVTGLYRARYSGEPSVILERPDDQMRRPRVTCAQCNSHVWAMETAMNGFDPLVQQEALSTLSTPGTEKNYERGARLDENVRELTLLRREFWLAPAFVRGVPGDKRRPFPPTAMVYLDTDGPVNLPEVRGGDVPQSVVSVPSDERTLWTAADSRFRFVAGIRVVGANNVELSGRNSAIRIYYATALEELRISLLARGPEPMQSFFTGPVPTRPGSDGKGMLELPLPDFRTLDITVRVVDTDSDGGEIEANDRAYINLDRLAIVDDEADEGPQITLKDSLANRVTLGLSELAGPRALVFTEINYPGWRATLDGEPVDLLKADGMYKAVIVPAGTHEVVFTYRPLSVYLGAAVSLVGFVVALGAALYLLVGGRWRRIKNPAESAPAGAAPIS